MKTILLADSGGTKTDWAYVRVGESVLVPGRGSVPERGPVPERETLLGRGSVQRFQTTGLHPLYLNDEIIRQTFEEVRDRLCRGEIQNDLPDEIFYYSAGCASDAVKKRIMRHLAAVFRGDGKARRHENPLQENQTQRKQSKEHQSQYKQAQNNPSQNNQVENNPSQSAQVQSNQPQIYVGTDVEGAARAAFYGDERGLLVVLGTGSICARVVNGVMQEQSRSLGFAIGDEGSAADIGKRLLKGYFRRTFSPPTLAYLEEIMHHMTGGQGKPGGSDSNDDEHSENSRYAVWMDALYFGGESVRLGFPSPSALLASLAREVLDGLSEKSHQPEINCSETNSPESHEFESHKSESHQLEINCFETNSPEPQKTNAKREHSAVPGRLLSGEALSGSVRAELKRVVEAAFRDFVEQRYLPMNPAKGEKTVMAGGVVNRQPTLFREILGAYANGPVESLVSVMDGLVERVLSRR